MCVKCEEKILLSHFLLFLASCRLTMFRKLRPTAPLQTTFSTEKKPTSYRGGGEEEINTFLLPPCYKMLLLK